MERVFVLLVDSSSALFVLICNLVDEWQSDNPYLRGNFAPVFKEIEAHDLKVSYGAIPADLGN